MPYKTPYGSHYHMTYGCHGATIACDTAGLTPCSDCCGEGGSDGGSGSAGGMVGGSPAGAGGMGEFSAEEMQAAVDATAGGQVSEPQSMPEPVRSEQIASFGLEGMSSGMSVPADAEITPEMLINASAPEMTSGAASEPDEPSLTDEEQRQVDEAKGDYVAAVSDEFRREFIQEVVDDYGRWHGPEFDAWKARNADLVEEIERNSQEELRHYRHISSRRRREHIASAIEAAYAREHPMPHDRLIEAYRRFGSLAAFLPGDPEFEAGLEMARKRAARDWESSGAASDPEVARRQARDALDRAATVGERKGAEFRRRHEALDAAVVPGSDPVEHEGVSYTQVDKEEFAKACSEKGVRPTDSKKDASVQVRPAVPGERLVSYAGDGTEESVAVGKEGHYVLTKLDHDGNVMLDENGHPNEWQVEASKFESRYVTDNLADGVGVAPAKPSEAKVVRVDRDIVIMVPWGEDGALVPQYIRKGGYLNVADPNDVYGISEQDYNDTYLRKDGVRTVPPLD